MALDEETILETFDMRLGDLTILEFFRSAREILAENGTLVKDYSTTPAQDMYVLETETAVMSLSKHSKGTETIKIEEKPSTYLRRRRRLILSCYADGQPMTAGLTFFPS